MCNVTINRFWISSSCRCGYIIIINSNRRSTIRQGKSIPTYTIICECYCDRDRTVFIIEWKEEGKEQLPLASSAFAIGNCSAASSDTDISFLNYSPILSPVINILLHFTCTRIESTRTSAVEGSGSTSKSCSKLELVLVP